MTLHHSGNFPLFSPQFWLFIFQAHYSHPQILLLSSKTKTKTKNQGNQTGDSTPTSSYSSLPLFTFTENFEIFISIFCLFPFSLELALIKFSPYHSTNTTLDNITKGFHVAESNDQFSAFSLLDIAAKFDTTDVTGHASVSLSDPSSSP